MGLESHSFRDQRCGCRLPLLRCVVSLFLSLTLVCVCVFVRCPLCSCSPSAPLPCTMSSAAPSPPAAAANHTASKQQHSNAHRTPKTEGATAASTPAANAAAASARSNGDDGKREKSRKLDTKHGFVKQVKRRGETTRRENRKGHRQTSAASWCVLTVVISASCSRRGADREASAAFARRGDRPRKRTGCASRGGRSASSSREGARPTGGDQPRAPSADQEPGARREGGAREGTECKAVHRHTRGGKWTHSFFVATCISLARGCAWRPRDCARWSRRCCTALLLWRPQMGRRRGRLEACFVSCEIPPPS